MRGTKAKAIRAQVYGTDYSRRNPYQYRNTKHAPKTFFRTIIDKITGRGHQEQATINPVTIYCTGKRAEYRKAKKEAHS